MALIGSGLPNIASLWLTGSWWIVNLITRLKSYSQSFHHAREKEHWDVFIRSGNLEAHLSIGRQFTFQFPDCLICWVSEGKQVLSIHWLVILLKAFISLFEDVLWPDEAVFLNNKTVTWAVFIACLFCTGHWHTLPLLMHLKCCVVAIEFSISQMRRLMLEKL